MHSLEEARGWIEASVDDVYGARVGQVVDVFFDPDERQVHWMLVRTGAGDGSLVPVPVHYSIASSTRVWVPVANDLIASAPRLDELRGLTREDELELCAHYGGLRRRSEVVRRRPEEAVTALPGSAVVPLRS